MPSYGEFIGKFVPELNGKHIDIVHIVHTETESQRQKVHMEPQPYKRDTHT